MRITWRQVHKAMHAGAEASFASLPRIKTKPAPRAVQKAPSLHCVRTVDFGGGTTEASMSDGCVVTYFANGDRRRLLPCGAILLSHPCKFPPDWQQHVLCGQQAGSMLSLKVTLGQLVPQMCETAQHAQQTTPSKQITGCVQAARSTCTLQHRPGTSPGPTGLRCTVFSQASRRYITQMAPWRSCFQTGLLA